MILLDTHVVSETFKKNPDQNVITWLDSQDPKELFITAVTLAGMEFGMRCMPAGNQRHKPIFSDGGCSH